MQTEDEFQFKRDRKKCSVPIITALKALSKGCTGLLAYVIDKIKATIKLEDVLVVCEFPDVFPNDFSLPPK